MASTDKTPKLGLNQWAAGDDVLRADFNADNAKIDAGLEATKALVEANRVAAAAAALAASDAVVKMASGELAGDGKDNREVVVGFRPRLVLISNAAKECQFDLFNAQLLFQFRGNTSTMESNARPQYSYTLSDTGFCIKQARDNALNYYFRYIAFG